MRPAILRSGRAIVEVPSLANFYFGSFPGLFRSAMATALNPTRIYLSKRHRVILPPAQGGSSPESVATVAKNVQALGFGLKKPLLERLMTLSEADIASWYASVLPILKEMVGAHRQFSPMYPNFPKQVMQASEAELFFNAMTHYFGFHLSDALGDPNLVVLPKYEKEERPSLDEFHELRWIDLGDECDFNSIFTSLTAANGSLSESDQEVLRWFVANRDIQPLLAPQIPQKETLALLVASIEAKDCLAGHIKTATDVLRVAVAMSHGDVSLAQPTKFRNFSKSERRFLLGCLEQLGDTRTEDMLRWKDRWIRLGERLHPGDFKQRFPHASASFDTLRNGLPYTTYNSRVEKSFHDGASAETLRLLTQRPGEFARRLDHLLRSSKDSPEILGSFFAVADHVSTPVLMQVWGHFRERNANRHRAFFPKGNVAKVQLMENPLPPIADEIAEAAVDGIRKVLVRRFSSLPPLGKCYIDERLKQQFVPFSQRSASRALKTVARGSWFELPQGGTVRFFCWWQNIESSDEWESRVDIDLSASLFNDRWEYIEDIAYYNLRAGESFHSGDITSAPQGACEFIDMDLQSVLSRNARYIVMSVLCYTGQAFVTMPECFGGWMMRQEPNSGEIFEPKTVKDKVDLTAPSRAAVPVILDVVSRRVIWADVGLKSKAQLLNAARNSVGFNQIGRAIVELHKPTLFDLFEMHVEGRGERVTSAENADTVFGLFEGTITAFDGDIVLSEFLA